MMRGPAVCAGLVVSAFGCGDPPLCPSEVFVAIQESQVASDGDTAAPGIQTDVHIRTSLREGELLTLEVIDNSGAVTSVISAPVDASGNVTFPAVTVPEPVVTLRATGDSVCGRGEDQVTLDISAGADCALSLTPAPETNTYYAPLGVLSTHSDPDPDTAGYQTTVHVATRAGWTVELFANTGSGEQLLATAPADNNGQVALTRTLGDGQVTLRATCHGAGGEASSLPELVYVDTTRPACTIETPTTGSTITPSFDANGDLADGVQLALAATIAGDDVVDEPVTIKVSDAGSAVTTVDGSPVDPSGGTTATITMAPAATPATFQLELTGHDHAGNTCTVDQSYDVEYDGCDLSLASPIGTVTHDADSNPGNGSQIDIGLHVSPACAGRTVSSTCGADSPIGVVAGDGTVTLRTTLCATSPCETQAACTFRVTNAAGVKTQRAATLAFDDQGPAVTLQLVNPAVVCGAQLTPASDIDPGVAGVQIVARVLAPDAVQRTLELTTPGGQTNLNAASDVELTLAPGTNRLVGVGVDGLGNRGQTGTCTLTLSDIGLAFSPPAADGTVTRADGTTQNSKLTFALCGTVDRIGSGVQLAVDGAPASVAMVTGTTWCTMLTLPPSPPAHAITATATNGASFGTGSLSLQVDLSQ
jgi:hypothetical protein